MSELRRSVGVETQCGAVQCSAVRHCALVCLWRPAYVSSHEVYEIYLVTATSRSAVGSPVPQPRTPSPVVKRAERQTDHTPFVEHWCLECVVCTP
jgi:hypothetical protein